MLYLSEMLLSFLLDLELFTTRFYANFPSEGLDVSQQARMIFVKFVAALGVTFDRWIFQFRDSILLEECWAASRSDGGCVRTGIHGSILIVT